MKIRRTFLVLAVWLTACGQTREKHSPSTARELSQATTDKLIKRLDSCPDGGYIDPSKVTLFMCHNLKLVNGYTYEQAIKLVLDREDNAWKQLRDASERMESAYVAKARMDEAKADYGKSPRLSDVEVVYLSKTMDSGEWVVGVLTADKRRFSLWLTKEKEYEGGRVRSVTDY